MRNNKISARADAQLSHHGCVGVFQNAHELARSAAIGFDTADVNEGAVAVHGFFSRFKRDIDVAIDTLDRSVRDEEAVALAMHVEAAGSVFASGLREDIIAVARLDEGGLRGKLSECGFEIFARASTGSQFSNQLFEIGASVRQLRDVRENQARKAGRFGVHGKRLPCVRVCAGSSRKRTFARRG